MKLTSIALISVAIIAATSSAASATSATFKAEKAQTLCAGATNTSAVDNEVVVKATSGSYVGLVKNATITSLDKSVDDSSRAGNTPSLAGAACVDIQRGATITVTLNGDGTGTYEVDNRGTRKDWKTDLAISS